MKKLLFTILAAAVLTGCGNGTEAEKQIEFLNGSGAAKTAYADETSAGTFTFRAKADWKVAINFTPALHATQTPWLRLKANGSEISEGKAGEHTLTVELDTNNTSGASRTASIFIACGSENLTLAVTQREINKADDPGNDNGGGQTPVDVIPSIYGRIANFDEMPEGNYVVKLFSNAEDRAQNTTTLTVLAQCEVKSGFFYIDLSNVVLKEEWKDPITKGMPEGITISDPNVKETSFFLSLQKSDGTYRKELSYESTNVDDDEYVWAQLIWFSDKCEISGTIQLKGDTDSQGGEGEDFGSQTLDIQAWKGWNWVYMYPTEGEIIMVTTTQPAQYNMAFYAGGRNGSQTENPDPVQGRALGR